VDREGRFMTKHMSRRAVLKAIGISPVILSAARATAEGEEALVRARAIAAASSPTIASGDLDDVMSRAAAEYKKQNNGKDWDGPTRDKYERIVRSLWGFFELGIGHVGQREKLELKPAEGLMKEAYDYGKTTTGVSLVTNLGNFNGDHGTTDMETEICAWRCGKAAAEAQLETDPASKEIRADAYEKGWLAVKGNVDKLMAEFLSKNPGLLFSGGGC
jgi:hypothetical protein